MSADQQLNELTSTVSKTSRAERRANASERAQIERCMEYVRALSGSDLSLDAAEIVISEVALRRGDRSPPRRECVYQWLHYWKNYGEPWPVSHVWEPRARRSAAPEVER